MAGIRESIDLDITAALAQVRRLEQAVGRISAVPVGGGASLGPQIGDQERLRRATDATTAATGKYGRTLQTVAQIRVVQGLVAFFGGRALVRQITDTARAASDLNEEVSRTQPVFDSAAGSVRAFGDAATTSVALARREAIRAANDFGTMFRGAGLSAEEAARLSQQFVRLGADIASFSNLTIDDALTKLRAGLAGEIEPLRRVGFGFNDLEVQAKAAALGLADSSGELTESAKLQARIQVILEKTKLAQGDLARTSEGLANQQRFLRAEAEQLREELGRELQPVFLELVHAARENLPAFGELASNVIPLLIEALRALNPAGQAFLELLVAFSPALSAVAAVLDAIPQPLLQLAGTMILLNRLVDPLAVGMGRIGKAIFDLAAGASSLSAGGGIASAFSTTNVVVAAAAIGLTAFTAVLSRHRREQAETERVVRQLSAAFLDQAKSIQVDVREQTKAAFSQKSWNEITEETDLNLRRLANLATQGLGGFDKFVDSFRAGTEASRESRHAFADLAKQIQESARAALNESVTQENLTRKQVDRALATRRLSADEAEFLGVEFNYLAALRALDPALAAAVEGTAQFGDAAGGATGSLDALNEELGRVRDQLDAVFGRFLDAEEATAALENQVEDLASALGEGRREGESSNAYQRRLAELARDAARAVEAEAAALAEAGRIAPEAVPAVIQQRLQELVRLFPELRGQLLGYIGLLGSVPAFVSTTIELQIETVTRAAQSGEDIAASAGAAAQGAAAQAGQNVARGMAEGIASNLAPVADAGRDAGAAAAAAAAKEVRTTLRRSAGSGLDLGGFLVDGISLGARQAEIDLRNLVNSLTIGMSGVVADAARIDPAEAQRILQAVEAAEQAARDLADARRELGADSIEAALAELQLADAQAKVNDAYAEAIDSADAYDEALKRVTDGVDSVVGSLRAMNDAAGARSGLRKAREEAEKATQALVAFDQAIADAEANLAVARAGGDPVAARRAQATLEDLVHRRGGAAERAEEANLALTDAELDLLDAQQRLVDLGPQVADAQGVWEGYLRSLAEQAGLTRAEVDALVGSLNSAAQYALDVRTGVLTGGGPVAVPNVGANLAGANLAAGASVKTTTNYFYITAPDPTSAARQVVSEMRVEELLSG